MKNVTFLAWLRTARINLGINFSGTSIPFYAFSQHCSLFSSPFSQPWPVLIHDHGILQYCFPYFPQPWPTPTLFRGLLCYFFASVKTYLEMLYQIELIFLFFKPVKRIMSIYNSPVRYTLRRSSISPRVCTDFNSSFFIPKQHKSHSEAKNCPCLCGLTFI